MPVQPSNFTLLDFAVCDDVRSETRGKLTLVGFYGRNVLVDKIPATLPKLSFLARFPYLRGETTLNLQVSSPSGVVLLQSKGSKMNWRTDEPSVPDEYRQSQIIFHMAPMKIEEEGVYRIEYEFVDGPRFQVDFYVAVNPSVARAE